MSDASPLFDDRMRYCVRCCIPETEEGTDFDELGICQACRNSEQKMHIDWDAREEELERILREAKEQAGDNYDCIIPISGGKDSTFQLHVLCEVYDMHPLAVTFSHNWFSETGWYNLVNSLETFNVDHMMFTPNRDLVNRLAKRSVEMIGDTCWHCHMGVGSFPLHVAAKFDIPLLVYGEPSYEGQGYASYEDPIEFERETTIKVSAKKRPAEMVDEDISLKELKMFRLPSQEELDEVGVQGIWLGDYLFWDDERQMEFVRDRYGWRETQMEGTYKCYKSAECIMPGMHDFTLYLKRGYGRATIQASVDVRNGLLTREEGFELARENDAVRPEALDYFLEVTGMTEEEFHEAMGKHRMEPIKDADLPVKEKEEPHPETIRPVAQQWIERMQGEDQAKGRTEGGTEQATRTEKDAHGGTGKPSARAAGIRPPLREPTAADEIDSFLNLSVQDLLRALRDGAFSPVDLAEVCIRRVEELNDRFHAFTTFDADVLLDQAREVEGRIERGQIHRPLEGVPVGVKDMMNTKDLPTEMGSPIWEGFTPGNDARVVFHLRRDGGLVAGKTVTSEFAVHALGPTLNPHDPSRTPGTSSSGSAAAVALGMVPVALGSQTAASIVRPASYMGVWGVKPSFGLIPRTGTLKTTDSLDTLGFFTTWLEDIEQVFNALRVRGEDYPKAHAALNDPERQEEPDDRPWRIALARTHTWDDAEPYARKALTAWADKLASADDVEVVEPDLPASMEQAHEVHRIIYDRSLAYYFQEEYKHPDKMSEVMLDIIDRAKDITPDQYRDALREQDRMAEEMDDFLKDHDAVISLSTAGTAPRREGQEPPDPGLMWTMTHLPVVSAPVFVGPDGLPFGAQLAARRYNDPLLFDLLRHLAEQELVPAGPNPVVDP